MSPTRGLCGVGDQTDTLLVDYLEYFLGIRIGAPGRNDHDTDS
ncbi:hypothetical protein Htur_4823 (plasmid) [Haloterrigena turkmenica DSM 5511]|uniref:Uncharacterized protein n=1 Tax=Haloterrigena turkmenica (strain ATCC 51198 / DSM 5511 / JCM 9101 / NCIMB 13204 / VKM B-1734 / 4k) TaxID=543526 RepID=D2S2J0_HALTV|nr:hypothetical protein Htur_4823 [Haloterrigena turkmenica DSM 5511]